MALEQPKYKVDKHFGDVEIRTYESYRIARCELEGVDDLRTASNAGFRYLFNYISGANNESQKIAMTVPVQQFPTKSGWSVSFVVPSTFKKSDVPIPNSSKIEIIEVSGGKVAALKYRGLWGSSSFESHKKELLETLAAHDIKIRGEVFSAVYNPPLTPPFLRRNEVLVAIG